MLEKIYEPIEALNKNAWPQRPILQKNSDPLIEIEEGHPKIFIKPFYFQQRIPSSLKSIYLRRDTFERLQQAALLLPENYSFILYDGYRPLQVQQYLFADFKEKVKKQYESFTEEDVLRETRKFVAFPEVGSEHLLPHLTGGAIDLTLGDTNGNALDLGTEFDELSEKSATRYFEQHKEENKDACMHRRILYNCMTEVGFTNYSEEWWHYDYKNLSWAKRIGAQEAVYGAIEAEIQDNQVKGYRFI